MFQVALGKLPADFLLGYLPFSLMKVLRKIYSIDKYRIKLSCLTNLWFLCNLLY
ncbi:MAG: hypothetical protein GYA35_08660 [Thermoanaerobaculaceae bacterium]|nr:hypothetical protein [Thermoanaerobaculaceae bacterium]